MALAHDVLRPGRPPKLDDAGTATRERLLAAAAAACVEHGFEGTTVIDIARRADVSAPAIYNHFGGKVELLIAAGRAALDRLRPADGGQRSAADIARLFLADDFADTRRLLTELHLAGQRHVEVADLLAKWHGDHAATWVPRAAGRHRQADVKLFFALLLGLCQIDSMASLGGSSAAVGDRVAALLPALFPKESGR